MLKKILLGAGGVLALGIVVVLVLAALKPDTFSVERSVTINAPSATIMPLVTNFRNWTLWSPYEKPDPDMKRIYANETAPVYMGINSTYEWEGNSKVGHGRMRIAEILQGKDETRIVIKLDFIKPFEAHNDAIFKFVEKGPDKTEVTWTMTGPMTFFPKIIHVLFDMDDMVGGQFAEGLANLKAVAEKP
ncbi:MAG: SRPBCC family protein [Parvibaculaceae bacterium]